MAALTCQTSAFSASCVAIGDLDASVDSARFHRQAAVPPRGPGQGELVICIMQPVAALQSCRVTCSTAAQISAAQSADVCVYFSHVSECAAGKVYNS